MQFGLRFQIIIKWLQSWKIAFTLMNCRLKVMNLFMRDEGASIIIGFVKYLFTEGLASRSS